MRYISTKSVTLMMIYMTTLFISACVGSNPTHSLTSQLKTAKEQFQLLGNKIGGKIQQVDLYQKGLYSLGDVSGESIVGCDKLYPDQTVCASVVPPYAVFGRDIKGSSVWLQRNYLTKIELTFKNGVPKDFYLQDIYNQLPSSGQVSGYISQLNTDSCDKLLSGGSYCEILITYTGAMLDESVINSLNFVFSWKDGGGILKQFNFNFKISNRSIASIRGISDLTKYPVISLGNESHSSQIVDIKTMPTIDYTDLDYDLKVNNKVVARNIGNGVAISDGQQPSLNYALGDPAQFGNFNNAEEYNLNAKVTDCAGDIINPGDACDYPFYVEPSNSIIGSKLSDLLLQYNLKNGVIVNSVKPFIISIGDINLQNIKLNNPIKSVTLSKHNISENMLSYSIPLSNLSFYLKYIPQFKLSNRLDSKQNKLLYGYGDTELGNLSLLASKISITVNNSDCFNQVYDPEKAGYDFNQNTVSNCDLTINSSSLSALKKPYEFALFAKYTSPTQGRMVEQFIGFVSNTD